MSSAKIVLPSYQRIAISIAENIADGKYMIGQRLSGRSTLASQYAVSSETIRKAVWILQDVGILSVKKGSGIVIESMEKALRFIERYREVQSISDIRSEIIKWVEDEKSAQGALLQKIEKLLEKTEHYDETHPFLPYKMQIVPSMKNIGKKSADLAFWQNTGATIIAIKRSGEIILSPGPYATFYVNDILYFVGEKDCYERVKSLFTHGK